ncbi:MAG: RNA polymerase sigma factor [Microgenomates group bacterium]|nr:RNA polymerase sigma factor [Microgenomates group bacterium]
MNYKNLSDEKIVEEVIKNKEVFAEIIDRYRDKILRYIFYLVGNKKDAEDIAQEVFIKVYVNLLGFNKKLKFSSWLFRIAHNEAVNFLKKKKINLNFDERVYKIDSEKDIEEDFSKKEIEKTVKNCLTELPVIYREVVDLYYFENLSYEEISDVLKVPAGTVAIRLSRAKKILKNICQNQKI